MVKCLLVAVLALHLIEAKYNDSNGCRYSKDTRCDLPTMEIHLYTRENVKKPVVTRIAEINALVQSPFSPKRPTIFYVHGWLETCQSTWSALPIKDAALRRADVNYICVDWTKMSTQFYFMVLPTIPKVGEHFAFFLKKFMEELRVPPESVTLVGFSFGAHVVGKAGSLIQPKVKIVGLDPAKHGFRFSSAADRLDPTDGSYVQVIHGNGAIWGFEDSIGHADFYPNGGLSQPGCPQGILDVAFCSHLRTPLLYAASLNAGNFTARKCENYRGFSKGNCARGDLAFMGEMDLDLRARGNYYLKTRSKSPYVIPTK